MGDRPGYAPLGDFYCVPSEYAEDLSRYGPGGFHPVHLGDVLSVLPGGDGPRYRILHKLGYGGQATVWLAEDMASEKFFKLHGPNGEHDVLVFNLCFAMKDLDLRWSMKTRRRFGLQLVQGLSYLHAHGIVHGDLHRANLGIHIRAMDTIPAERVLAHLLLRLTPVVPRDCLKYPPALMPKYTVDQPFGIDPQMAHRLIPLIEEGGMEDLQLQIMDLGESYGTGQPIPEPNMRALVALSPEILLGDFVMSEVDFTFGVRADLWALGCTLFELLLCFRPFPGRSKDEIWCMMCGLAEGQIPEEWRGRHVHLDESAIKCLMGENTWSQLRADMLADPLHRVPEADVDPALALVQKLLVLEPSQRAAASEVLRDEWLVYGSGAEKEGNDGILELTPSTKMLRGTAGKGQWESA